MNIVKSGLFAAVALAATAAGTPFSAAAPLPTNVAAMKAMLDNDAVQVRWRGGYGYGGLGYRGWGYRGVGAAAAGAIVGGAIASSAYYNGYPYGGYGVGSYSYGGGYGCGDTIAYCPSGYGCSRVFDSW